MPMPMPSIAVIKQTVRVPLRRTFAYVNIRKAASLTIKRTLLEREAEFVQELRTYDFGKRGALSLPGEITFPESLAGIAEALESAYTFTVVRNPYARVLSAYLDKIAGKSHSPTGPRFAFTLRYGRKGDISFTDFLEIISGDAPHNLDRHWRPLTLATFHGLVRFDHIGHMETLERDLRRIVRDIYCGVEEPEADGSVVSEYAPHRTSAAKKIEKYYTDKAVRLAQALYRDDFECFGYSLDPMEQEPRGTAKSGGALRPAFKAYLQAGLAVEQGDFRQAEAIIQAMRVDAALAEDPNVLSLLGTSLAGQERLGEALDVVREAAALNEGDPFIHLQAAGVLTALGRHAEAVRSLRAAARLDASVPVFKRELRRALLRQSPLNLPRVLLQKAWKRFSL